jgi:hypothetical protein
VLPPRNMIPPNSSSRNESRYAQRTRLPRSRSPTKFYEKLGSVNRRLEFLPTEQKFEVSSQQSPKNTIKEINMRKCFAIYPFKGEFDGCLEVKKSEKLMFLKTLNDGWSYVENEKNCKGCVPSDYLSFGNLI